MKCRINPRTTPIDQQLDKFVKKSEGCWEWTGSLDNRGYGRIRKAGRMFLVHRLMYERTHGPIPTGTLACHICDNKICCRPDHIFLGSVTDNAIDAAKKGLLSKKLSAEKVKEIRELHAKGTSVKSIAKRFGVVSQMIYNVLNKTFWAHVT